MHESSATTLAGSPRLAMAAATASLLPTCPAITIIGRPEPSQPPTIRSTPSPSMLLASSCHGPAGEPHELDHVAGVLPVRTESHPHDPRVRRRQAQHVPEVDVGRPALGWPREIRDLRHAPDHAARDRRRHVREDGGRRPIADDRRLLDEARRRCLEAPVGRLELSLGLGHLVAEAFVLAAVARSLASFLDTSVPVSVSLSSPRMKASTRSRATSSWSWSGGLFMK